MTHKEKRNERFSLARWSQRKLDASPPAPAAPAVPAVPPTTASAAAPAVPSGSALPPSAPPELPPIESLHFDSDFTAFLRPEVDEKLKRAALKQLFRDPRFNVMDGLDTYIDDYTKADPIPADVLAGLLQRGFGASADAGHGTAAVPDAASSHPAAREGAAACAPAEREPAATLEPSSSGATANVPEPAETDTQKEPAPASAGEASKKQ